MKQCHYYLYRISPLKASNASMQRALLRTAQEVAKGMDYIHSFGIVHGDLKPGNVLLKTHRIDRRGYIAKVSDFGQRLPSQPIQFTRTTGDQLQQLFWGAKPEHDFCRPKRQGRQGALHCLAAEEYTYITYA